MIYRRALIKAWTTFNTEYGWSRASHVAMSMLLALFPFCIFTVSLASILGAELEPGAVTGFVFGAWPDEIAGPVIREIETVLKQKDKSALTLGFLLADFFASNGVNASRIAIAKAYRKRDPRPLWRIRLQCIVFVFAGALLLCLAGVVSVVFPVKPDFTAYSSHRIYDTWFSRDAIRMAMTIGLLTIALIAAHVWLPGVRRPFKDILPGILLTIFLWIACGFLFILYLSRFGSYSVTYAGLAGAMGALVFLYLMSAIFVLGAEFNSQLARLKNFV